MSPRSPAPGTHALRKTFGMMWLLRCLSPLRSAHAVAKLSQSRLSQRGFQLLGMWQCCDPHRHTAAQGAGNGRLPRRRSRATPAPPGDRSSTTPGGNNAKREQIHAAIAAAQERPAVMIIRCRIGWPLRKPALQSDMARKVMYSGWRRALHPSNVWFDILGGHHRSVAG